MNIQMIGLVVGALLCLSGVWLASRGRAIGLFFALFGVLVFFTTIMRGGTS